jgi:hypothetical protein
VFAVDANGPTGRGSNCRFPHVALASLIGHPSNIGHRLLRFLRLRIASHTLIVVRSPRAVVPQRRPFPFGLRTVCRVGVKSQTRAIKPSAPAGNDGRPPTPHCRNN